MAKPIWLHRLTSSASRYHSTQLFLPSWMARSLKNVELALSAILVTDSTHAESVLRNGSTKKEISGSLRITVIDIAIWYSEWIGWVPYVPRNYHDKGELWSEMVVWQDRNESWTKSKPKPTPKGTDTGTTLVGYWSADQMTVFAPIEFLGSRDWFQSRYRLSIMIDTLWYQY